MKNSDQQTLSFTETPSVALEDQAGRDAALDTKRSFLVQAPAGSGKTELLIRRFLKLLAEVDEPEQVLAITFTRAATAEMRTRVIEALDAAAQTAGSQSDDPLLLLASGALRNNAARSWNLLEQPHRLNIQTIDSLCLNIAYRTPLLSRLGGALSPTEHAQPLYAQAARRTLAHFGGDREELSRSIRALLEIRDTRLNDCENLIADMLAKRDLWGPVLRPAGDYTWQEVRAQLEEPFHRERKRGGERARALLAREPWFASELLQLAAYAHSNLEDQPTNPARFAPLQGIDTIAGLKEAMHWSCVCDLLLTKGGKWRAKVDVRLGFPPGGQAEIERMGHLLEELQQFPDALEVLCELKELPPASYSQEQWDLLEHIVLILRYAAAELRVLFAEESTVDFVELGLAARQALNSDPEGPDAALPPALAWHHLLVDEFQDTSRAQYELLSLLVDHRDTTEATTCFLVGDPMQSIYGFRQAEVELFERTRLFGLGKSGLQLHMVTLKTNFRSHAGLVDPLNIFFGKIFAGPAGEDGYKVDFAPSTATRPAPEGLESVQIMPRFLSSKPTPDEKSTGDQAEADDVVRAIERARSTRPNPEDLHIAILVRAKKHLSRIAQGLRNAHIPYRAVEIEQLSQRQEIVDLTSLTRALLHPMDRIAWLSVLRAPWCGLTLADLHLLCGEDDRELARKPILQLYRQRSGLLGADGRQRASRTVAVLEQALDGMHRQVSFSSWVERVWRSLGGRECVDLNGYENARAFFRMLEELPPDGAGLDRLLGTLFAEPDPRTNERSGVQLMTIHKAKGLGFDLVFVPGLHREVEHQDKPLLNWLERTVLADNGEADNYEFLVAPIGRTGDDDPLYKWITRQKKRREREEDKRLFYVACTRAREKLYLLGAATISIGTSGEESVRPGSSASLLKTAWPALENRFDAARENQEPASGAADVAVSIAPGPSSDPEATVPTSKTLKLRRLPSDWTFAPGPATSTVTFSPRSTDVPFERPSGSLQARALGHVVHALMEEATASLLTLVVEELRVKIGGWRPRAVVLLRQAGLSRTAAEAQSKRVVQALQSALDDDNGRWILSPHATAETEISWAVRGESGQGEDTLRTLRGDRIFRAGAEPLSPGDTHTWIVDYKTASHGSGNLDDFLAAERVTYRPQLEAYADALQKAQGGQLPVRLALYYPLLQKLLWWDFPSVPAPE